MFRLKFFFKLMLGIGVGVIEASLFERNFCTVVLVCKGLNLSIINISAGRYFIDPFLLELNVDWLKPIS